jgi:hypothetical protein
VYGQFNFRALYAFIVDFFEDPSAGPAAVARTKRLLKWWDKYVRFVFALKYELIWADAHYYSQIFPDHVGTISSTRKARRKLAAQRSAREESISL